MELLDAGNTFNNPNGYTVTDEEAVQIKDAVLEAAEAGNTITINLPVDMAEGGMIAAEPFYEVRIEIPEPVRHPVVREHPENGRPTLFVNPAYTVGLAELRPEESRPLLEHLYAHATRPEFVYRHRWNVGDVVMFDNRCLLHYVSVDYGPELHRKMHRTTAAGDRPYRPGRRPGAEALRSA